MIEQQLLPKQSNSPAGPLQVLQYQRLIARKNGGDDVGRQQHEP